MYLIKEPAQTGEEIEQTGALRVLSASNSSSPSRAHEIDGIRGWAALSVVLFHALGEMLKLAAPHVSSIVPRSTGYFAVAVFFVLSGDALSISFFAGGGTLAVDRLLVRRYFRLTIPILMSCLATYLIMIVGVDYHARAAVILQRPDWLGNFLQFSPSFATLLTYSTVGVYAHTPASLSYNPFLWTMAIELQGSIIVFLLCYLWPRLRHRQAICLATMSVLAACGSYYSLFIAGLLLGHWRQTGQLAKFLAPPRQLYSVVGFLAGWTVYFIVIRTAMRAGVLQPIDVEAVAVFPLAVTFVLCVYTNSSLKRFFANRLSRFLGEISFPLYLIHFQVLISFMSWLIVKDQKMAAHGSDLALSCIAMATVIVSIAAAWPFRQIERFALKRTDSMVLRALR